MFGNGRDGGGLDRTHGYGGGQVEHVAVVAKRAKADQSQKHAEAKLAKAKQDREVLTQALAQATEAEKKAAQCFMDGQLRTLEQNIQCRTAEQANAHNLPDVIYARDGGRDSAAGP